MLGIVVHRLLQRLAGARDVTDLHVAEQIGRVLRPGEIAEIDDRAGFENEVICAYHALRDRPDVGELYASGDALHEVPFTMRVGDGILRGTIDCLVRTDSGGVTILEFKTGRPRPEHARQAELYRHAAERLFPGAAIESRLVYVTEAGV
jgi:ATP-dependent exoDNAse (exonuclease V) beta subunit